MAEPPGWLHKQTSVAGMAKLTTWGMTEDSTTFSRMTPKWLPPPPEQRRRLAPTSIVAVKTRLCHRFVSGRCNNPKCTFAHGEHELRRRPDLRKTKLCDQWLEQGRCLNGFGCTFAHGQAELQSTTKFYKTTLCPSWKETSFCESGDSCRHAHGQDELRFRHDRIPPPPESRFLSRLGSRDPATPPPPGSDHIPSPPAYPPPATESGGATPLPPNSGLDNFGSSTSFSETDYQPRPATYAKAKRGQRSKASSFDLSRPQRRPPPPPPPPISSGASALSRKTSITRVPPPPLQDARQPSQVDLSCDEDWGQTGKQVDRADGRHRRASMIELRRRRSQYMQWGSNNDVANSLSRRQSVICIDRLDQKPAAVDAYPLAALASKLTKPRRESGGAHPKDEQVTTGVLMSDEMRVRRGLPVSDEYFSMSSSMSMDEGPFLPPFPARGFVLLPAGWFASADFRAPAALTAWFLPPGVRCPVVYSKPAKSPNTAARLWPCSEWAESTILSTDIPPSTHTSIYG